MFHYVQQLGLDAQVMGVLAQAAAGQGPQSALPTIGLFALMIGILYLMIWRPQQKQVKEHKAMLSSLKKGDVVVTNGGIVGRVHAVAEKFIVVEAGRDVRFRILPNAVTSKAPAGLMDDVEPKAEQKA